jgi:hypothetical protein
MTTFDPPRTGQAWQLPWLRVSLILRQMAARGDGHDEDLAALLTTRRELAQRGWFN